MLQVSEFKEALTTKLVSKILNSGSTKTSVKHQVRNFWFWNYLSVA